MLRIKLLTFCTVPHAAMSAGLPGEVALTAVAAVDSWPGCDFGSDLGRDRHKPVAARRCQFLTEQLVELTDARVLGRGGRLERRVDQAEAEERHGDAAV